MAASDEYGDSKISLNCTVKNYLVLIMDEKNT